MANSVIYSGNNVTQPTVATGTVISFPSIVRRYGCNLNVSGGNVIAKGSGYYKGIAKVTYTGTTAGTINFRAYKNGVEIPFSVASATTAENVIGTLIVPFEIKDGCNCENTITIVADGAVVNVTNASILVEKH